MAHTPGIRIPACIQVRMLGPDFPAVKSISGAISGWAKPEFCRDLRCLWGRGHF